MDFFAQVNERLLQPSQPKSSLRPYFEAHLLFQATYHSPSASPSTSPEPEEAAARPPSLRPTKRKPEAEDEEYNSSVPCKRRRRTTFEANAAPSPPTTDDSRPPSPRLRRIPSEEGASHPSRELYTRSKRIGVPINAAPSPPTSPEPSQTQQPIPSTKRRKRDNLDSSSCTYASDMKNSQQSTSMKAGKYSLRWTASRARRAHG